VASCPYGEPSKQVYGDFRQRPRAETRRQFGQTKDLKCGHECTSTAKGYGPCRIARATGISRKQVARLLESEGITRAPPRPASFLLPEILELRGKGYGFAAIGRQLGFSRNAVRLRCREAADRADPDGWVVWGRRHRCGRKLDERLGLHAHPIHQFMR
jgi:DNA-binding CsgD family transcriptional regulator